MGRGPAGDCAGAGTAGGGVGPPATGRGHRPGSARPAPRRHGASLPLLPCSLAAFSQRCLAYVPSPPLPLNLSPARSPTPRRAPLSPAPPSPPPPSTGAPSRMPTAGFRSPSRPARRAALGVQYARRREGRGRGGRDPTHYLPSAIRALRCTRAKLPARRRSCLARSLYYSRQRPRGSSLSAPVHGVTRTPAHGVLARVVFERALIV